MFGAECPDTPQVQAPDFEKYKGTSCPKEHLKMYVRKMSTYANDNQVLIHYFQDSLIDAALKWYMNLDCAQIRTFNDLREAFVQQYKFNVDMPRTEVIFRLRLRKTMRHSESMPNGGGTSLPKSAHM